MNDQPAREAERGFLVRLENWLFRYRTAVLLGLVLLTIVMGWYAAHLRMDAGFEKQLPIGHEYIDTFETYRDDLLGANRLIVVVKARDGKIWTEEGLERLYEVTQAVTFLPPVSRSSVMSLWTPNAFINEITEEGFRSDPLIPGTVTPEALDESVITSVANSAARGGFIGTLVSRDQTSAMITAELKEFDTDGQRLDYVAFNHLLEEQIRAPFEDYAFEIQIIGFAKQIGDIAAGAGSVLILCLIAMFLTGLAVYWYCRSLAFTLLVLLCSMASLVWQFGSLHLLGYGLDPLAVLVPFLVFAIGVSHGVQQVNFIVREIAQGRSTYQAARASFRGLLIPGVLALITAFVSFITLLLIPIPMVQDIAITASLGVAYKIITNLIMLPLAASMIRVKGNFAHKVEVVREQRSKWLHGVARFAQWHNARWILVTALAVSCIAEWQSHGRVVGSLEAGAPELRSEARFNQDALSITNGYDIGLDWLTVVFEHNPVQGMACSDVALGQFQDRFVWAMHSVPGVLSISSFSSAIRQYSEGYNEGNPKMRVVPIDPLNYSALALEVSRAPGLMRADCSMTAVHLFLADHKATTINGVIGAVKAFREQHSMPGVTIRLASGNAGVQAAINEEIQQSELPMLLYVYAAIALLVFIVYRDWRAVLICCLPLTIGTLIGYWFMKELQIGLTIATLPVMVLAVGIGVDYAFYIYNRLQFHMAHGHPIAEAVENALLEVGVATIFTAITLTIGVATWAFSELQFQSDMGLLLAFMFIVNMVMAITVLPAFAVFLERFFPRRYPIRLAAVLNH